MPQLLNDGWQFSLHDQNHFAPVALPHDWLISDPRNLYQNGTGWYKRKLDARAWGNDQRVILRFDGVYMDSTLFVNGRPAFEWKYGYTAFDCDITDYLRMGETNTLLLRVVYQSPNSRWYSGAGIYRDVTLTVKDACHIKPDGVYIATHKQNGQWKCEVSAETETGGKAYTLKHTVYKYPAAYNRPDEKNITPPACFNPGEADKVGELLYAPPSPGVLELNAPVETWDILHPQLYLLRSELTVDGRVTDTADTRFGFREIEFTPDRGFFLNGRPLKLNGVCLHHDLGALGAAVYPSAIRRQLVLLREMGVNAIRTAHNPPARAFMELCDEMGFLVMSEILDMWEKPKTKYDYARFFHEWIERDTAAWVRRDRNSPSVIMWSVGNEIYDTHASAERGGELLKTLIGLVRKHDPAGHAPVTFSSNYMPWENTQACADIIKLVGYNYAEYLYDGHHAQHPDWVIFGGETLSTVQSRGVYHFPLAKETLANDDWQCSCLGNGTTSWGAKSVEACLLADLSRPFSLGHFMWAGQDYIGEPTPYNTKNCYFGHLDTAGFPKDTYFVTQAAWLDRQTKPMVHLFPYWDFSPGQPIDVRVCTNAPRVELFLNGESLGIQALDGKLIADWQIPYTPGELRAAAYDHDGNIMAESVRRSFGDAVKMKTKEELYGELLFVSISAEDAEGNPVENANRRVVVHVADGVLLGLDNGDSTDYDPYQNTDHRRLFNGKLLALVRQAPGQKARVSAVFDEHDIPIRKIELAREPGSVSAGQDIKITAKLYPPNASYARIAWRLTDAGGVDSPLGRIAVSHDNLSAVITPKADGEIYVRCMAFNGGKHPAFISLLPLELAGLGPCFMEPYQYVFGGLYSRSNIPLAVGNERGVATERDGVSHVGFTDLDFGAAGSDRLTLDLYTLSGEPFTFEVWEGMPLSGGRKLCDVYYDKGSVWNTYQPVPIRLPQKLKGIITLCFLFRERVHIKGFIFEKQNLAFNRRPVSANDGLYGDSFTVNGEAVEGIGNNVSILFNHMDFGESGTDRVTLRWRSVQEKNSVQVVFNRDGADERVMVELPRADTYTERTFELNTTIRGNTAVRLLFLPGCSLDLESVCFIESQGLDKGPLV